MTRNRRTQTEALVDKWADEKNSFISADLFDNELETWSSMTNEDSVESACEVGCGSGVFLTTAVVLGWAESAVGIDALIEQAGTHSKELQRTQEFVEERGLDEDVVLRHGVFPDDMPEGSFDLLIFRNVLHHIYDAHEGTRQNCINDLRAAKECLTCGGYIYIVEPTIPSVPHRFAVDMFRTRIQNRTTMTWEQKRRPTQWMDILREAGYKNPKAVKLPTGILTESVGKTLDKAISFTYLITAQS